jgi:Rad3-related DNA helicase
MFVNVVVRGNCYPYRDILNQTYGLRWHKTRKAYTGEVDIRGRKIKNLEKFCDTFNLKLWVNGQIAVDDSQEEEESDFVEQQTFDDSQLGKLGVRAMGIKQEPGWKKITVTQDTEPIESVDEYFAGTRFDQPRRQQQQVVPLINQALDAGYENIVVECPVGSGKSAMAMVVPKMYNANAYIVTPLKGLQKQYLKEMPFMRSVMGKGNYDCSLDLEPNCRSQAEAERAVEAAKMGSSPQTGGCTADTAPCSTIGFKCAFKLPVEKGSIQWGIEGNSLCDYFGALREAHHNRYFVGNTSYLMGMNQSGRYLAQRDLLIVDEAHTLPGSMADFYSFDLSVKKLERLVGIPTFNDIMDAVSAEAVRLQGVRDKMLGAWSPTNEAWGFPKIGSIDVKTENSRHQMGAKVWIAYLTQLRDTVAKRVESKAYDDKTLRYAQNSLNHITNMMDQLATNPLNVIWQYDNDDEPVYLNFKPLNINHLSKELLLGLGSRRIFMSGTIADQDIFVDELGLDRKSTCFIKVDYSSFPLDNRPIFTTLRGGNLGRSRRNQEQFHITAEQIIAIAKQFPDQKGLVLPFTDEIERNLVEAIQQLDRGVADRIVQHTKGAREREAVFEDFDKSKGNQILFSTYANQGYDGGSVGFCVIPKLPFPSLGDVRIVKKTKANPDWYKVQTGVMLTQMLGRIVRSPTDKGKTYILDPTLDFHMKAGFEGSRPLSEFMPNYMNEAMDGKQASGAYQSRLW